MVKQLEALAVQVPLELFLQMVAVEAPLVAVVLVVLEPLELEEQEEDILATTLLQHVVQVV
jgi:hypothetical protein